MTARQRSAGLLLLILGVCAAALVYDRCLLGAHPVPARTAQRVTPSSPEPPLADAPLPPGAFGPGPAPGAPCPVDPPVPVVTLRLRVPACVVAGQELHYHILVENCSRAPAHHVVVRNPLPPNTRFVRATPEPSAREPEVVWQFGTLEPCACREILLVLLPLGPGALKDCARVQFEHGQCVCTRVAGPPPQPPPPAPPPPSPPPLAQPPPGQPPPVASGGLTLSKQGPADARVGDPLPYRLVVTNGGSAALAGVKLTDTLPEGLEPVEASNPLSWELGTLAPGQSVTREYQAIAKKVGSWTNRAVVTTAAGERQESSATVRVGERPGAARLEVKKTGPEQHFINQPATYQITVTNTGTVPATNVVVVDPVPEKTEVFSAGGGRLAGAQLEWALGTLAPGGRKTVQVLLRATAPGEVVNHALARADRDLKGEDQVRTLFEGATGLTMEVDALDYTPEVGADTKYLITVVNQGAIPATNVVVTATVPEQFEVRGAKGPFRQDGQKVIFEPVTLPPQKQAVYEVSVKALHAGEPRFKVDMTADQLTSGRPVHREQSSNIYNPNIPPP